MLSTLCLLVATVAAADQPNVVLIITDDQGYGDLSCHGNDTLKTPNLDALHADSVRLTDYHVAPTCSPTRAALLTGHWTNRTGVWHTISGRSILRHNQVTLASMLSDAGYRTAMFGKWHLGDNYPSRPQDRGFDEVFIHGGGGVGQTPDYWDNAYFGGHYFKNGKPVAVDGHCTDVWFDAAESFIRQEASTDRPFFAYIATNAPHGPMHSRPEYAKPYESLGVRTANFLGMIAHIDDRVGQLRRVLEAEGIADDTLLIFTTDNGTAAGDRVFNAGMRGKKGSPYEGGHRVPSFWHWPNGRIAGGRDFETLTGHVDVLPTVLELCGVDPKPSASLDGISIAKPLRGLKIGLPKRTLVTDSQRIQVPEKWRNTAVMQGRWRLVNRTELYDITADPGQKTNVAASHPDIVRELTADYDAWWDDVSASFDDIPTIVVGNDAESPARLTCHDWYVAEGVTPWNQAAVRQAAGRNTDDAVWNVTFDRPGRYRFTLRRWPAESGHALSRAVPPGESVPGEAAFRTKPGKALSIDGQLPTVVIKREGKAIYAEGGPAQPEAGAVSVEAEIDEAFTGTMSAFFAAGESEPINAYYVSVERLGGRAGDVADVSESGDDLTAEAWRSRPDVAAGRRLASRLPVIDGSKPQTWKQMRDQLKGIATVQRPTIAPAAGVTMVKDIPFVVRGEQPQRLDVFLPAGEGPHPVVMLVHGGGWRKGSRTGDQAKGIWLANHGIAAVAIDYRLGDAHPYPALMHDLQQSIAWVRSDSHGHPFDDSKLVLFGGSAGATMVALAATYANEPSIRDPELDPGIDLTVDGVVVVAGPTDTQGEKAVAASFKPDSNYHVLLRGSIEDVPEKYREFNPTHWASPETPPMLFIDENTGGQSEALRSRLDAVGVPYEQHTFKNVVHGSWNSSPWFEFTMERTASFARRVWADEEEIAAAK